MGKDLDSYNEGGDAATIISSMEDRIEKLLSQKEDDEIYECTDFKLECSDMKQRIQKCNQPPNGYIFTITISKR